MYMELYLSCGFAPGDIVMMCEVLGLEQKLDCSLKIFRFYSYNWDENTQVCGPALLPLLFRGICSNKISINGHFRSTF